MNKNKLAELGIFKDRQDGTLKNVYKSIDSNEIIEMTLVPKQRKYRCILCSNASFLQFGMQDVSPNQ